MNTEFITFEGKEIKRGEIYYISATSTSVWGSEQGAGRPAVIISNDDNNKHSSTAEIVYLTAAPKKQLPTHVPVRCKMPSTALCEQVTTVSKERILDYYGCCTAQEMRLIDNALLISLALAHKEPESKQEAPCSDNTAVIERDMYKKLYEQLLDKLTK